MQKTLEFPTEHTFQEWLRTNGYTKEDEFASVWNHKGKCVAATHEKREHGKRIWCIKMYI